MKVWLIRDILGLSHDGAGKGFFRWGMGSRPISLLVG